MDKYEYRVKTEQMLKYVNEKAYDLAMEIADTIDWRKVKNVGMLTTVSEIYEYNGEYRKGIDILSIAYERSPGSRKLVYKLGILALKSGEIDDATDCYEEFMNIAPKDPNQYILRYKILKAQKAPIEHQIEALEDFKKAEYIEKWAYELAKLYDQAGKTAECLEECDDLILWFSEGKYVYQAMELKMKYKPLTPLQQEKYSQRYVPEPEIQEEEPEELETEEPEAPEKKISDTGVILGDDHHKSSVRTTAAGAMLDEAVAKMTADKPQETEAGDVRELYAEPETVEEIVETAQEPEEADQEEPEDADCEPEEIIPEEFQGMFGTESDETEESGDVLGEQLTGQLKIEEILREWEEKQRENAKIIEEEKLKAAAKAVSQPQPVAGEITEDLMEESEIEPADEDEDFDDIDEEMESEYEEIEEQLENDYDDGYDEFIEEDEDDFFDGEEIDEEEEEILEPVKKKKSEKEKKPEIEIDDREIDDPEDLKPGKYDTGFVVQGRYDLSVTSEIGLKAGLTEEQKELFSYFVPVRGMSEQLVEILENDKICKTRYGTSRTGNLLIIGQKGSGKTVLAVDIVKAIQKQRNLKQGKVAIVTGEALNKKDLKGIVKKLQGGAIIIEKAGKLSPKKVKELNHLMEEQTGELLFVLEEQRKPLERMLTANPSFKKKFTSRLEIPKFISHDLVTFGQTYANENGYRIDEGGILALYARIDLLQREDHSVTVAEVKEIIDEAIEHSQRANVKHLMKRVFGKNKDDSDRIILKEQDF